MDHQEEALKVYIGLLRSSSHLEQVAKQDVRCYGLNLTEFSVLELLYHKGTHHPSHQRKILIASSSTTYVIDQLVKRLRSSRNKSNGSANHLCQSDR